VKGAGLAFALLCYAARPRPAHDRGRWIGISTARLALSRSRALRCPRHPPPRCECVRPVEGGQGPPDDDRQGHPESPSRRATRHGQPILPAPITTTSFMRLRGLSERTQQSKRQNRRPSPLPSRLGHAHIISALEYRQAQLVRARRSLPRPAGEREMGHDISVSHCPRPLIPPFSPTWRRSARPCVPESDRTIVDRIFPARCAQSPTTVLPACP